MHRQTTSNEGVHQYWNDTSLLDIASELELSFSNRNTKAFIMGRHDLSNVLKMMLSLLEQHLPARKDPKDDTITLDPVLERVQQECNEYELNEHYDLLAQYSYLQWTWLETQVAQKAIIWLQPLYDANCKEDSALSLELESVNNCLNHQHILDNNPPCLSPRASLKKKIRKRNLQVDRRREIEEQIQAITYLEGCIEKEAQKVQQLKIEEELWYLKCSMERASSSQVYRNRWSALCSIAPFELSMHEDKVEISFPHMDDLYSRTTLRWKSTKNAGDDDVKLSRRKRDSLLTIDSLESSDSSSTVGLFSRAPEIIRLKTKSNTDDNVSPRGHKEGYLPTGSVAHDLYTILLDGDHMKTFITRQFQGDEPGLLNLSDVFHRLALVAKDIMVLQKYYSCRLEIPPRSSTVILHVTISLGQSCSLGLRFTYNLSDERTILYCIPSDVYIMPITGEPAVPINILLRVANSFLGIEPRCNAFILRRTCSAIVDTVQGRT